MKKILALILAIGLLCCLFACTKGGEDAETTGAGTTAPTESVREDPPKTETKARETAWAEETDELGRALDPLGLPQYENGTYVIENAGKWEVHDVSRDDFLPFIDFLKENGVTYDPGFAGGDMDEDAAFDMDFWGGIKDGKRLTIFLMFSLKTGENYFSISVSDVD